MMNGEEKVNVGTIKTDLEKKMTCGSGSYPRTKDRTVGLLNNYNVVKKHTHATPVKEEFTFVHTSSDTKTSKTNNKRVSDFFHCGDPNHCY